MCACLVFAIVACNNNSIEIAEKEIDLDIKETQKFNLSEFIIAQKHINLELTDESAIGYINKCVMFNNSLYVLDAYYAKKLMEFDLEGDYIRSLAQMGTGPGEYNAITDFVITDKYIHILSDRSKIIVLNKEGNFIRERKIDIYCDSFASLDEDTWLLINNHDNKPGYDKRIYLTNDDFEIISSSIVSEYSDFHIKPFSQICKDGQTTYFSLPLETQIYKCVNGKISLAYNINIPDVCKIGDAELNKYRRMPLRERHAILQDILFISYFLFQDNNSIISFSQNKERFIDVETERLGNVKFKVSNLNNDVDGVNKMPFLYSYVGNKKLIGSYFNKDILKDSANIRKVNPILYSMIKENTINSNPIITLYKINDEIEN